MAIYIVQPNDTMYLIANRFGTTVERLQMFNNIANPHHIWVGMSINIPDNTDFVFEPSGNFEPSFSTPGGSSTTRVVDGLRYTLRTDKRRYTRGERVVITFTKCNTSSRTITLRYDTSQRFDVVALRDNREVWRWSDGQFFGQVRGSENLAPGQCRTYTATWDLRNKQGNFVALDDFAIRAFNVAPSLRDVFVQTSLTVVSREGGGGVTPTPIPPGTGQCPSTNIIRDPGLEQWQDVNTPTVWSGTNVRRTRVTQSGAFAAELGARPNLQAVLTQKVNANAGQIYRIEFAAREQTRRGGLARFILELEVFLFNRAGEFIGRIDPTFTPASIPDQSFNRFSFTTGRLREGTVQMEVRFILRPGNSNDSSVIIDNVSAVCVRT